MSEANDKQREELPSDTELLDWLQARLDEKRYTGRCVFRWSTSGRGWRFHETVHELGVDSVRGALAQAMRLRREAEETGP